MIFKDRVRKIAIAHLDETLKTIPSALHYVLEFQTNGMRRFDAWVHLATERCNQLDVFFCSKGVLATDEMWDRFIEDLARAYALATLEKSGDHGRLVEASKGTH